ncbi:hypothetical protein AB0K02_32150 [Streptomyces sp. NPDC049597]|uniref:hypothetical protein n=1 Tax=Streptomyces sp. NPDC049597 TaxID=3155276 RepID=UPI003414878C
MVSKQGDHPGDARVNGAHRHTGADGHPAERVVLTQACQADRHTLVRRKLASSLTLTGDDEFSEAA